MMRADFSDEYGQDCQGIAYKLDAPKRQEAQNVSLGSQEDCSGTTETMGEIPSTARLKAKRSDETAIRRVIPAVTSTLTALSQCEISPRAVLQTPQWRPLLLPT
jgi:hypothetical protein